jgi:hypothetical protein
MTDVLAAAVDDLFADPILARPALWRPGGTGDGVPVRVIARRPDQVVDFSGARIATATTLFDIRVTEAADLAEGDTLEVDGEVLVVQGVPLRDAARLVWMVEARPE